jgi:thiol-disulfide isomerase/thioredoxin
MHFCNTPMILRKGLLTVWILVLLSGICYLFWHEDWKYSLPTPLPEQYTEVRPGSVVKLEQKIKHSDKPLFLHFFNPSCPCSRFNIPHFRSLVKKYGGNLDFAVVVMSDNPEYGKEQLLDRFDIDVPVYFDKAIADSCGVYSTPQAVIIDANHKLYFRGNYNKSRYCTDKNTNFAQMAIDSLLSQSAYSAAEAAIKSYGCSLPSCNK